MTLGTELGVWISPGLGTAYPGLRDVLARIYSDRVASIPWVPQNWLASIQVIQGRDPSTLVRIGPAMIGPLRNPDAPAFADNAAKLAFWQDLFDQVNKAVALYAAGQQAAGKAEADRIYANANFWNEGFGASLITTAKTIADAPAAIVRGTLGGIGDVAGGILKSLAGSWVFWGVAIVAAGFAAVRFGVIKLPKGKRS